MEAIVLDSACASCGTVGQNWLCCRKCFDLLCAACLYGWTCRAQAEDDE